MIGVSPELPSEIDRLRRAGHVQTLPLPPGRGTGEAAPASLEVIGPLPLPVRLGGERVTTQWCVAAHSGREGAATDDGDHVSVISFGAPGDAGPPLVRVHSTCFTGDVLGSMRCDCGPQLEAAMTRMHEAPEGGLVIYMAGHEGRGIGLWQKAAAYLLQDEGFDTYEANRALGFRDDARDFRAAAALIAHWLGDHPFRLLTNNPDKVQQLRALGLDNVVQEPHVTRIEATNLRYLQAKRKHGHAILASAFPDPDE